METAAGCEINTGLTLVAKDNVNDVALVSVLLTLGLFHGLFLCFFFFVDSEQVIADCSDMSLLHLNCLTGVNSLFT